MDTRRTYSRADLARELGRPRSTVAYWIEMFSHYLPSVGNGRNKRYKEEALHNLKIIEQMKDRNEPNEMVEELLRENTTEIVIEEDNTNEQGFFADIAESYKALYEQLMTVELNNEERQRKQEEEMNKMRESLEESNKLNRELAASLEEVKKTLKEMQEEKPKGFFQRMFGK